jgi:hypothetical protein
MTYFETVKASAKLYFAPIASVLCKIGLHRIERKYIDEHEALVQGWWFFSPPPSHDECVKCGKKFEIIYEVFDGTDNA